MSLVGSQVFANPTKSCWVSSGGDVINGSLIVNGGITATGGIQGTTMTSTSTLYANTDIQITGGGGDLRLTTLANDSYIQSDNRLRFTQLGFAGGNTNLLMGVEGTNTDVLTLGGVIASSTCAGTASIAPAATQVVVACSVVTAGSKIFLSHKGLGVPAPANGPCQNLLTYGTIVPGTSFVVELNDVLGNPIPAVPGGPAVTFDWLVIN